MRDPRREKSMRLRILVLAGFMLLWGFALLARAYDLQIRSAGELASLAERQHETRITLKARRGMIFDRNGKELAISLPVQSIFAQPALLVEPEQTAKALASILGMDARTLLRRFAEPGRSFVWVARRVESVKVEKIRALDLPGIGFIEESKRHYPGGELAGHVLGFVGIDSVGLEGVEFSYDRFLRGSAEEVVGARDARGRAILARGLGSLGRLEGDDLTLTLDARIQSITEKELARGRFESGAKSGTAVVMDPATGEILAMAVEPRYDPNDFERYTSREFRNRAVTDVFEPGSTMKTFLLAAALESGVVSSNDIFFCENGEYNVYDRVFHDTKPHGWLSAGNIVKVSSNIGAIKIAEQLGGGAYYDFLRRFGFGQKTGIDLAGEVDGLLKSPRQWSGVSLATLAFGQGIGVTPVQLLSALSAVANGGVLLHPTILKEVRSGDGRVIQRGVTRVADRVISEEAALEVTRVLERVVSDEGTGRAAQVPGYSVAGKTGTAQKVDRETGVYSPQLRVVSFMGYVPARAPRLAILVVLDEPDGSASGGGTAGPVFARIAEQSLAYLEVPPDRSHAEETAPLSGDSLVKSAVPGGGIEWRHALAEGNGRGASLVLTKVASNESALPDFTGMPLREVLRWERAQALDVQWTGHGVVIGQRPASGTPLQDGMEVHLTLRPPG